MRWWHLLTVPLAGVAFIVLCQSRADSPAGKQKSERFGIDKRVPWTRSRVKGSPEPPLLYRSQVAFPGVRFNEPLDLQYVPGRNRLAVAERRGKIFTFSNNRSTKQA